MPALVLGVAVVNGVLLGVGYCLLSPALRGVSLLTWVTWSGLALLTGAATVGVALCGVAAFGLRTNLAAFAVVAAMVGGIGLLATAVVPPWRLAPLRASVTVSSGQRPWSVAAATAATFVGGVCAVTLFAGFRSSPWLDDTYTFWVPKGLLLTTHGLDERLFTPGEGYVGFANPEYPLWWSVISGLDLDLVGSVDLRAVNAQIAVFLVAFVAAVARLLNGRVAPGILWTSLALLVVSPELLRQTQSGGADMVLAMYLALTVLCAVLWLTSGEALFVVLAAIAAAAAASIKVEGAPQIAILVGLPSLVVARIVLRRSVVLLAALAAAWSTTLPWRAWCVVHDVPSSFSLADAVDPTYLADRAERVAPTVEAVAVSLGGRDWPFIVPAFIGLTVLGLIRERRPLWLLPAGVFLVCVVFWVWTYWAGWIPLDFWLSTSTYRVVDGLLLATAVTIPLLAERLVGVAPGRCQADT